MSDVRTGTGAAPAAQGPSAHHGSFIWYELITPDPDAAKAFYEAVVGWEVEPGDNDYPHLKAGDSYVGGFLKLSDEMRSHGARPTWLGYIAVDDVDAAVASIEQHGGKALMPAFNIPDVGRIALVADPQGAPFYVMKPVPPADRPDAESDAFSPDAEQRVNWNELSTADPDAARRFYGDQFGWTSDDSMPMGEYGEYRFFDHGSTRIGAVCGAMPDGATGWRYYVGVPSIAKAAEAVKVNGGAITVEPHQVPGGDWILIGTDPQGAQFALVGKQ